MTATEFAPVGLRQPCPCGSGRRYKACHGREDGRRGTRATRVERPLAGVPSECDWVALRELVPSATAPLRLSPDHPETAGSADRSVIIASVLPGGWPAAIREDGTILLGLQVASPSADPGRDLAAALVAALAAPAGEPVPGPFEPGELRIGDLVDASGGFPVTVHPDFGFWTESWPDGEIAEGVAALRERADAEIVPSVRLTSVEAAYWCSIGDRLHLRWVQPYEEDALLDALARMHVTGANRLLPGTRFIGSFRACGLLVPVWDLPEGRSAEDLEKPAQEFGERLAEAVKVTTPLTTEERGARAGLANRQLTLR